MAWPQSQEYNEAIQSPDSSFADPELRTGEVVTNALGLPIPYSGNFADVYQVHCPNGSRWAVKCFTREVAGLRERYQEISRCLQQAKLPFTVEFTYLEKGIRIRNDWFPLLKMQWVEGFTLNEFVRQYLDKPVMFGALLQIWGRMATRLRDAGIAHADLQHGNVLMVPSSTAGSVSVKLIDYDGMFVPALANKKSGEVGHPSYQHPQRLREGIYSLEVDRFPLLLIATSMRCLKVGGRALWEKYDNGDNLLFRETDLKTPQKSALFRELEGLPDAGAVALVNRLRLALDVPLEAAPLLDDVLPELPEDAPAPAPRPSQQLVTTAPTPPPARSEAVATEPVNKAFDFDDPVPAKAVRAARRSKPQRQKNSRMLLYVAGGGGLAVVAMVLLMVVAGLGFWALSSRGHAKGNTGKTDELQARAEPKDKETIKPLREADKDASKQKLDKTPKEPDKTPQQPDKTPVQPNRTPGITGKVTISPLQSYPSSGKGITVNLNISRNGQHAVVTGAGKLATWTLARGFASERPAPPELPRLMNAMSADWSVDNKHLLTGTNDGDICLWNVEDIGKIVEESHIHLDDRIAKGKVLIRTVALSPDNSRCFVATSGGGYGYGIWDLKTQKQVQIKEYGIVFGVQFLPDGRQIIAATTSGVFLWDAETGEKLHRFEESPDKSNWESLAVSPDGKRAAFGSRDKRIHVLDLEARRQLYATEELVETPWSLAISADGLLVAAGFYNRAYLECWDLATGEKRGRFEGPEYDGPNYRAHGLGFTADGRTLIGIHVREDNAALLKVWKVDIASKPAESVKTDSKPAEGVKTETASTIVLHAAAPGPTSKDRITGFAITRDGHVLSTGYDKSITTWSLSDPTRKPQVVAAELFPSRPYHGLRLVPPDEKSVLVPIDKTIQLIDLTKKKVQWTSDSHDGTIPCVDVTADGKCAVTACTDKIARVWDLETGKEIARFTGHVNTPGNLGSVRVAHFLANGERVVTISSEMIGYVWDAKTGHELFRLTGHRASIFVLAVTADGKRIVTGAGDSTVRVWDASTGRQLYHLEKFPAGGLALSPDGRLGAVGAGGDNPVRFWDMATGQELLTSDPALRGVSALAFSPDGRYLLGIQKSAANRLQVWEVSIKAPAP